MNQSCLVSLLFFSLIKAKSLFKDDVSNCYWTLRDKPQDQRVVHSIRQDCMEGAVWWQNPFGGIEAVFQKPSHPPIDPFVDQKETRYFCYSIEQSFTQVKVDREVNNGKRTTFKKISSEDCIEAENFKLYAESVPNTISNIIGDFKFKYVWRPKSPFEKCRLCSTLEINIFFCSSQLVSIGKIDYRDENFIYFHLINTTSTSSDVLSSLKESTLFRKNLFHDDLLALKRPSIDFVHGHDNYRNHRQHINHPLHHHQHHCRHHPHRGAHETPIHHRRNIHRRASKQHRMTLHRTHDMMAESKRRRHLKKTIESIVDEELVIPIKLQTCHLYTILPNAEKKDTKSIEYLLTGSFVMGNLNVDCIMEREHFVNIWKQLVKGGQNMCLS